MAVILYVTSSGGNNNNSGSSTGAVKASGTGAATVVGATVTLSVDTPDLSTVVVGDTIRLNARVDGKNGSDIFEITAVDDGLDTVDVTPAPTSITSGVTWAIGGQFATLQRATNVLTDGDLLYAKGTYDESVDGGGGVHDLGGLTTPITVEGYTTTPGDGGMVTLDSNNTKVNGWATPSTGSQCWHFKNIRITRYTNQGFRNLGGVGPFRYTKCRTDNCGGTGFNPGPLAILVDCYSHNNTGDGFATGESPQFVRCIAADNGAHGFNLGGGGTLYRCLALSNVDNGIHQTDDLTHARVVIIGCVIDGDAKDTTTGISLFDDTNPGNAFVVDTVVYDCGTGISQVANHGVFKASFNNLVNANTTAYSNFTTESGGVTSAPAFVAEESDYTPAAGSPLIGAGLSFADSPWFTSTGHDPTIGLIPPIAANVQGAETLGAFCDGWGWD